ncbi:pro-resilin isoform X2 [Aedes aegypti]|uniref:Uncharacterized protein n=1 Tax=Aedes aegypti TaxID=7159 RepID=A0A6I8TZX5_AEDAE|nr:pro-resilin isoform X2 [Aedes aegypti]
MVDVAVFRKLVSCALVLSVALVHRGSCASLSNGGRGGDGIGESTVGESASSSKLVTGPTLGSLYRSARDEYGRYGREQRCATCGGGGGYADRDMRTYGGRPGGVYGYYGGRGSIYDDRNWYYRPEVYDDRYRGGDRYTNMMMGYDDRYMYQMSPMNRYDDRYYPMSTRGYYDNRGEQRMPSGGYYPPATETGGMRGVGGYGYRGNGYDNLDPLYEQYMTAARGGLSNYNNRDRYYGAFGGYGGYGAYDHKNFRPWDETYSRPSPPSSSSPSAGASGPSQHQYPSAPSSPSSSQHHYQHQSSSSASYGAPTGPAGTYTSGAIGFHGGPDRPDANRPCCSECCGPNRYPPGPTGTGPGYHQPPPQQHHQNQPNQYGDRPDSHGRPGAWNYLSGGSSSGGQDYHQGASAAGSASHSQPGQDYGNRGGYPPQQQHQQPHSQQQPSHYPQQQQQHRPDASGSGDRQQNTAYGSRPYRPASNLGATSYLMDRETGDSPTASQLHSPDGALGGGGDSGSSSSSSSSNDSSQGSDGKPVAGENPPKSNES